MKYALGVDVGGTNIRIALVDENGNLYDVIKEKTNHGGVDALVSQIVNLVKNFKCDKKIEGIGIGVPGPVKKDGTVIYIPNLDISTSFNLKEKIEKATGLPTFVGNDANVAGLAEACVGAGKGYDVCQYFTLSTGIGGGLIIDKKMVIGTHGFAQEVGSMVIKKGGRAPSIYKPKGCIEGHASGTSLTKIAKEAGLDVNHAGEVFELSKNDNKAKMIIDEFIDDLACFIGSIEAYMDPDIFILGGGLMKSSDYFYDKLIERVDNYVHESLKGKIKIVKAKFDQDCGIIGAAMQCF